MIDKIGFASLIALFAAFFAAIVYFSALSSKGRFSTDFSQSFAVQFFSQAFYVFSLPIFLMPFTSGWFYFLAVLFLYFAIFGAMWVNIRALVRDFSFDDYVQFRQGMKTFATSRTLSRPIVERYIGIGLIWFVVFGELLAFSYFDTYLPLYGWLILLYSVVVALFQVAMGQGFLFNVSSCVYARVKTTDGLVEGFIVARGSDYYLLKTREKDVFLSNSNVKSISPTDFSRTLL